MEDIRHIWGRSGRLHFKIIGESYNNMENNYFRSSQLKNQCYLSTGSFMRKRIMVTIYG